MAIFPVNGYFKSSIEEISSVLSSYSTDFSDAVPDFFNIGFDISKPAGFNILALILNILMRVLKTIPKALNTLQY